MIGGGVRGESIIGWRKFGTHVPSFSCLLFSLMSWLFNPFFFFNLVCLWLWLHIVVCVCCFLQHDTALQVTAMRLTVEQVQASRLKLMEEEHHATVQHLNKEHKEQLNALQARLSTANGGQPHFFSRTRCTWRREKGIGGGGMGYTLAP